MPDINDLLINLLKEPEGVFMAPSPDPAKQGPLDKPWGGSVGELYNMYRHGNSLSHSDAVDATQQHLQAVKGLFGRDLLPNFSDQSEWEKYLSNTPMS
jgi:hypothetical protein